MNNKPIQWRRLSFRIAVIYAVLGACWIFLSDKALLTFVRTPEAITQISMIKGWTYVLLTALVLYYLVSSDMKKLEESQKAVRESKDILDALLNAIPEAVFLLDLDMIIIAANKTLAQRLGKSIDELIGSKISALLPPEVAIRRKAYADEVIQTCKAVRFEDMRNNKFFDNSIHPIFDAEGQVAKLAILSLDITKRKQAEEAFKKLVVKAPIGIFIVQDRRIKIVNPGLQVITGYGEDELLAKESYSCIAPGFEKFVKENVSRMLKGLSSVPFEFPIINKNGEKKWVMESVAPIRHEGEPATVVYLMDISAYKGLEAQLLQTQKMEAVGTLAGGVAHDFNNILTAIMGNIGMAMLDKTIGPKVQKRLVQAELACHRAQALSQQLLTFAKGGAPIKKIVSIPKLLKETIGLTLSGSKSRCELSIPVDIWSVEADEGQINQVFNNLLINSDQSMPEGGIIKISAENIMVAAETDLPSARGKYVKLTFSDQGVGISSKNLPKIFDPYFSTKQRGSGLGLATVYSIVKNHSGYIQVESQVDVGTTFYLYLPAREAEVIIDEQSTGLIMGQGRVLVMDDEEMVRQILQDMLDYLGYEADFASDGSQALEKFVQAKAEGRPFAAVILDLTVPGGLGGKEAVKELLNIDRHVKAVVSSGYSDDPIMADFQKYGFCEVIAKPYKILELSKILQRVIVGRVN